VHGFLSLHQKMEYGDGRVALGPLEWISEKHTDAVKKDPKTAPPVLPFAEFFAPKLPAADPAAGFEPIKLWQAQARLFVRWALDSADGARRQALWKFVARAALETVNEQMFRECFELDFAAAQAEIAAYLPQAVRRTISFRPARFAKLPPLALRNASDSEIARIKGDWERLEVPFVKGISPELAPKYLEQARRTLRRAYDRGERDPRLLAVLGLCECDGGNEAEAREFLEAAINIGPIRPRANYELARLRFAEFSANPAGRNGGLAVTQAVAVLTPLFAARAGDPPLPEVYDLIGEVWMRLDATPNRSHLAVLDEGVRLFPRRVNLILRAAELNVRHGFRDEAAALVSVGARLADDDATRERVAVLQQQLATK
jgi:tetratricopeptide (TPR) repeat protein